MSEPVVAVTYVGIFDAVDAVNLTFVRGEPQEVDVETAAQLVHNGGGQFAFADPAAAAEVIHPEPAPLDPETAAAVFETNSVPAEEAPAPAAKAPKTPEPPAPDPSSESTPEVPAVNPEA